MHTFYENGLHFECQRCSFCCGNSPGFVYLSKSDVKELCAFFKISATEFEKKYCRWVTYYGGQKVLSLLEKKNYDCILWENGCSAYKARPIQCSTYPFWDWMLETPETWNNCAKTCPGMNKGRLHSKDEIKEKCDAYIENTPIYECNWQKIAREIDQITQK